MGNCQLLTRGHELCKLFIRETIAGERVVEFNWDHHKKTSVRCAFTPREKFQGKSVRPELLEHSGKPLWLVALWKMGEADPYPGEWALGRVDDVRNGIFGRAWVANGDVTPL